MADQKDDDAVIGQIFDSKRHETEPAGDKPEDNPAQPRDESGRFATAKPATPATPDADAATEMVERDDDPPDRPVPLKALHSEREKRQEEARLRAEAEGRVKAYEQQIAILQQQARRNATPQQPVPTPDPYTDPEGYVQHHLSRQQFEMENRILHLSERQARRVHGDALVDECLKIAQDHGDPSHFSRFPDPWDAMVQWGKRQKVIAKMGDDPDAYEKRLTETIRAKVLEELKAGKISANGQLQGAPQRYPRTLADNTSARGQGAHLSDEAAIGQLFDTNRRRA